MATMHKARMMHELDMESEQPAEPLSFIQLRYAARHIPHDKMVPVARNLGLSDSDLSCVNSFQQQHAVFVPEVEQTFLILDAWKQKDADNCTLPKLLKALRESNLNDTAQKVEKAVDGSERRKEEQEILSTDYDKCNSKLEITEKIVNKVSGSGSLYSYMYLGLGYELRLSQQDMDELATKWKSDTIDGYFIRSVLMRWRQRESENAVLGKLYKALRMLQYNNAANEVYKKCVHAEQTDGIDLT